MTGRYEIVATARTYIGTEFQHMGRAPGIGIDCAGVVICAMRANGLCAAGFDVPAYTMTPDGASMRALCDAYMDRIAQSALAPGDVVLIAPDRYPQHLGIVGDYRGTERLSIIHASNMPGVNRTLETRLMFSRACKFVAGYRFRGIEA